MLRLRPSELTLIPDDVEETFRRIALGKPSRARNNMPHRALEHSGRPNLRRGPQRLTRDAVTALGNIPILQPQEAVFTSVDEDVEDSSGDEPASSTNRGNITNRLTSPPRGRQGEPVYFPASPALRTMQLPFRLGRDRHDPSTHPSPDGPSSEEPRTPPSESIGHDMSGSAGLASADDISDSALTPSVSSDSTPGLRGGGGTSRDRVFNIAGDTIHVPSPLHQVQRLSSPPQQEPSGDPTKSPISPSQDSPTLYLQGVVERGEFGTDYTFRELPGPYTEPRPRSGRLKTLLRSLSSRTAPSSRSASRSQALSGPSTDDVFGTLPVIELPTRSRRGSSGSSNIIHTSGGSIQPDQLSVRPRHFSSDASGASAPYSYYGSLASGTRYPSSEHSSQDQFSRSQLDGAAFLHESRRGTQPAYPFPKPGAMDETMPRPASSGSSVYSSPSMASSIPYTLSPLPSMPYTRTHGDQNSQHLTPGYIEASTAVAHNLQSPLEPYAEHYQRQLQAQHTRQLMSAQPHPPVHWTGESQARRASHGHGTRPHDVTPGPHGPRAMHTRQLQQVLRSGQRSSEHLANPATHGPHTYNRSGQASRSSQRTSENAPVAPPPNQARFANNGRVQAHRAVFERLQNPGQTGPGRGPEMQPFRHSMPQTATSHDVSNRPREYAPPQYPFRFATPDAPREEPSSNPFPIHDYRPPSQGQAPPRQTSRPERRIYRPSTGAGAATLLLHPPLPNPLTGLALHHGEGTTSRHPHQQSSLLRAPPLPSIRTATSAQASRSRRRVPAEQREQENDGDRGVMALEEGGVAWRYGERGEGERMDETPPRVGRVEGRMAE